MLDNIIQSLSALGASEWLGIGGILVAFLFRSKVIKFSQNASANNSSHSKTDGNVNFNKHDN